ncbi:unnamed protein product [Tuber aestivum]|uniref:VPS9 domain-containing protein n=1 Tax=Tuber aestivum TaxID=59557 RepID=A0A292Q2C5_9PEZI|nr:unnamed protein product [Tuber aestivum]
MPLLNPYLRSFFRSTLPAQCTPVQDHILLVPTTDILTNTRDRETGSLYSDLAGSDEFLGSHVLRVPSGGSTSPMVGSRENRGKARQYTTFNGRTVVVKDSWVYSNKGFRSLNQAQLLNDALFYPDTSEPQQWLIYYISKPLIGSLELVPTVPASLRDRTNTEPPVARTGGSRKKDIKSFNELLMLFPMIARQMQPGLEKLFQEFEVSFQKFKPLPLPPPSPLSVASGHSSPKNSVHPSGNGDVYTQAADESEIRRSLESAIMSAVDLFQRVDQSQLNLLATSTELTGPAVDRLIERYVAEQLHDSMLFPRVCATRSVEDEELEQMILNMESVDLTQVGIPLLDHQGNKSLVKRLNRGIKSFENIGDSKSPQAMLQHLLETAHTLTRMEACDIQDQEVMSSSNPEKPTIVTMNADMLVSLLLIVVIRAKVPNLHACLSYMRNFMFSEDVEQGETGYVLSTLEAVLFHIAQDHALSVASRSNEKLWRSVRQGDLESVKRLLEPGIRSAEANRSRENSASRSEASSESEEESGNERGRSPNPHPTIEIHHPATPLPNQQLEESLGKETSDRVAEVIDDATSDISESVEDEESPPPSISKDGIDDLEGESPDSPFGVPIKAEPESLSNGVSPTIDAPEPVHNMSTDEGEELTLLNGIDPNTPSLDTPDEEAYTDPFEAAATDNSSSKSIGVSSVRLEDLRADGQEDADSLNNVPLPPAPKGASNARTATTRFEFDERPRNAKKSRARSVASLATTADDTSVSSPRRLSRTLTSQSQTSDSFSAENLCKTRNAQGESILMMAVQERRAHVLKYLLSTPLFDTEFFVEDTNNEGTTLLSSAVQAESTDILALLLPHVLSLPEETQRRYFQKADSAGRTIAHYLFHAPDLISRLGRWLPWKYQDKNGQTPLFALCRSYDHARYKEMVHVAIKNAQNAQQDGCRLHLDEHVDTKGNTLLHIAGDPTVLRTLLRCDSEVNATNNRGFTALMVASKYGRVEMVRTMFGDPRVDLFAKELRGLTAVELAKDDDVRNRIDGKRFLERTATSTLLTYHTDLVLFQNPPMPHGRITAVVRSFFVEDATIRVVVKSGAPSGDSTFMITTCRRSLTDFQFLAEWLAYENPGSWLPTIPVLRSPYQIPSKPSRSVLRDIQLRLACFLKTLLAHSTFSMHELLWEFFLVPELQQDLMIERSKKKAEARMEKVREEYQPVEDIRDVELFVSHAKDSVRSINFACRSVTRRANTLNPNNPDFSDAFKICGKHISGFSFLHDTPHLASFHKFSEILIPNESNPYILFLEDFRNLQSSLNGVMTALDRPRQLINQMSRLQKQVDKHVNSLRRSDRWPLGLLDDTRAKIHQEAADNVAKSKDQYLALSSELRFTHTVAAGELSSFHELHAKQARRAIRELARRQLVTERERLEGMRRAIRVISAKGGGPVASTLPLPPPPRTTPPPDMG